MTFRAFRWRRCARRRIGSLKTATDLGSGKARRRRRSAARVSFESGFVSREWLPELVNFRRDGYDFDARCDDGLVFHKDEELYNTVNAEGEILSKFLKKKLDYRKGGNTGFETCITRLQMQTYLCVSDFIRLKDKNGRPYGWAVAQYTTPEHLFGYDYVTSAYKSEPKDSEEKMIAHLKNLLPATEVQIQKLLK